MVISFVGMKAQEVRVKSNLKVLLESDNQMLDEVMVVAYGTAKKSAFTGSAAIVDAEEIGKIQTSNATQALVGKAAGVQWTSSTGQPGENGDNKPKIRIRGISSINAGNDPLIILDGSPYDGDMNNINTQDIESMTVLKDAASNALYGARGANGVIMITTKKGKSGNAQVTLDAKWGSNSRATRDYKTIKNPAQYYEMYYGALKSYFMNAQNMSDEVAHANANKYMTGSGDYGLGYNIYTVPQGQSLIEANGKINPNATMGNIVNYQGADYLLTADDWLDAAYSNSLRQEYNVSVSAGSDKSSFYSSLSYLDNEGITANSNYERLTGRMKADYQVKDWLKVGANMSYTHYEAKSLGEDGTSNSSGNIFAYATRIAPIYPLFIRDGQGNILRDDNDFLRYDYGDGNNAGITRPFMSGGNPYSSNLLDVNSNEGNAMTVNGFFEARFLKDFKFTWNSGVNIDESRATNVTNPYYGSYASSNGITSKTHSRSLSYNHQQLLNYNKVVNDVHNIGVMIGHESYRSQYYYLNASKSNMFDPNNSELQGAITENGSDSYTTDYNTEGYFGRIQYDYAEKYYFSGSYRRDASSRFHPDNRWGNFWSLGGAWMISKENFFQNSDALKFIDMLKIKASYGSQGNDNIGNFRYVSTYDIVNSSGNPAAVPYTLGNKDITWETNGNFNAGFDFEMFNNRFSGTVEYFYRKTSDMLFSFPLPPSYGYSSYYANVGDMRNQGVEAEFNVTAIQTKDFTWDIRLNLTHYKNKVTYLPEERKTMTASGVQGYSSGNYYYGEGIPLYTYRMPQFAGLNENGEALYYKDITDNNGNITGHETTTSASGATYYLCGTALPDVYGGFGTALSFKGFDLSVDFAYQIGGQVLDSDYSSMMNSPRSTSKGSAFHEDLLKAWTPQNSASSIPRLQFGDQFTASTSDRFLTSASYLSLQNINFGYTLPTNWVRTLGLGKLRVYMAADNVFLWSKRQGLDPRQSINGEVTASYYAPIRTISGGLTVTF
ncbi:SusC/RagA family TonB-linked outer membrane protein [Parabacteroides acidifaciens]|nr:SusC/RagA family TonB-linked outer membrane protein [Parabacteroides acidifaciens]